MNTQGFRPWTYINFISRCINASGAEESDGYVQFTGRFLNSIDGPNERFNITIPQNNLRDAAEDLEPLYAEFITTAMEILRSHSSRKSSRKSKSTNSVEVDSNLCGAIYDNLIDQGAASDDADIATNNILHSYNRTIISIDDLVDAVVGEYIQAILGSGLGYDEFDATEASEAARNAVLDALR